jgi:phosphatidate cytidylyltransferase
MGSFVDLKIRLLVSSISVLLVGFLVYFADNPILQWVIACGIALLGITALWEYTNMVKVKGIILPFWLLASLSGLYILANFSATKHEYFLIVVNGIVVLFFFAIFLYNFYQIEGAIINIATSFFGVLYIIIPLGLILKILYPALMNPAILDGRIWITYLIAVTKITDIGGYFLGKLWGKSKLAPHLSPGKTLIGGIAGFFAAISLSLLFFLLSKYCQLENFRLNFIQAIILGGLIGIFSQLGDLAESLLKRDAKVKDSNVIPGVGGVLDFLDSLLFTIPILYLFLKATGV